MLVRTPRHSWLAAAAVAVPLIGLATVRVAGQPYPFTTPVFGLATAPDGSLLAADAGSGIYEIRRGVFTQVAQLPGVTDMAPIGRGDMFAVTSPGFGGEGKLYRSREGPHGGSQICWRSRR